MGPLRRQRRHVKLYLAAPTVEDAVKTIRQRQDQERLPQIGLRVRDDGTLRAMIWTGGGRARSTLHLTGRLSLGGSAVVLDGTIREGWTDIVLSVIFFFTAAFLAALDLLIILNEPRSPAGYIFAILPVLIALTGYRPGRLRSSSFDLNCTELLRRLGPLLPPARMEGGRSYGLP